MISIPNCNITMNTAQKNRSSRPEVFLVKGVLNICSKFTAEHLCPNVISMKLLCNIIKIKLRDRCSPANLLHIFRIPFPKNTPGGLLLKKWSFPLTISLIKLTECTINCGLVIYSFSHLVRNFWRKTLRKKSLYSELFWSSFSSDFRRDTLYSVRMRENPGKLRTKITPNTYLSVFSPNAGKSGKDMDQNNSEFGLFLRRETSYVVQW